MVNFFFGIISMVQRKSTWTPWSKEKNVLIRLKMLLSLLFDIHRTYHVEWNEFCFCTCFHWLLCVCVCRTWLMYVRQKLSLFKKKYGLRLNWPWIYFNTWNWWLSLKNNYENEGSDESTLHFNFSINQTRKTENQSTFIASKNERSRKSCATCVWFT